MINQTNPHVTLTIADPLNFGSSRPAATGIGTPRLLPRAYVPRSTLHCTARWDPSKGLRWSSGGSRAGTIAFKKYWLVRVNPFSDIQQNLGSLFEITSSTAQGGGGSFKNRKPIEKVGCCESQVAERSH